MGAVTFGIPKKLVLLLKEHFSIEVFVETGTFKGKTSIWASGIFNDVYTLENSKELFDSTSRSLVKYRNIHPLYGNSARQLNTIVSEIKQPAIFWLDAHWCGGNTFGNDAPCPLLDARPQNSDLWPGLKEIIDLLNRDKKYFTFVSEDVIVALPETGKKTLQPYFDEIHKTEYPGGGILSNILFASRNILRKWGK
jgi:hypothetical protein